MLVVTALSVVILMLVDIGPRVSVASGRWESALASLMVGTTLILALRAAHAKQRSFSNYSVAVASLPPGCLCCQSHFTSKAETRYSSSRPNLSSLCR